MSEGAHNIGSIAGGKSMVPANVGQGAQTQTATNAPLSGTRQSLTQAPQAPQVRMPQSILGRGAQGFQPVTTPVAPVGDPTQILALMRLLQQIARV